MAKNRKKEVQQTRTKRTISDNFLDLFRCIGLFFDVATLMIRMLVNVLIYDTPHGKHEMQYEGSSGLREGTGKR